jgi:hypothetical protein
MLEFIADLWQFMRERKNYWLAPIILILAVLGFVIVFAEGSALAPFIYTLFSNIRIIIYSKTLCLSLFK